MYTGRITIRGGDRWRRSVAAIGGLLAWRDPIALMHE
jgi:hypothetical protein